MAAVEELCQTFRDHVAVAGSRAPMLAALSAAIADRPAIAELLAAAPTTQQSPVLLLAAIHAEVLGDPACELAAWFPTTAAAPRTDDLGRALERFTGARADALRRIVATRVTQTNEIGRCGLLLPVLGLLAGEAGPLGLLDVGASAGLNLQIDRYAYEYRPGGRVGAAAPVTLAVATRGPVPVPDRVPAIGARLGIDRQPVDIGDAAEVAWLRACVWPDQRDRFARLAAALEIARANPVEVRRGDAVADLAAGVETVAAGGHPVVVNTWVLSYLTARERAAYLSELRRIGAARDLSWVYAESPAQTPELPHPRQLAGQDMTVIGAVCWRGGEEQTRHVARAHPHGYWMHWEAGQA